MRRRTAAVIVDKNFAAMSAVADRIVILVKGATVYEGSTAELRAQPQLHRRYLGGIADAGHRCDPRFDAAARAGGGPRAVQYPNRALNRAARPETQPARSAGAGFFGCFGFFCSRFCLSRLPMASLLSWR